MLCLCSHSNLASFSCGVGEIPSKALRCRFIPFADPWENCEGDPSPPLPTRRGTCRIHLEHA
nr:hypothetical protein [Walnut Creek virus]